MILKALRERSGELAAFVPDFISNATEGQAPQAMSSVASRPDGEHSPSYPADDFTVVLREISR